MARSSTSFRPGQSGNPGGRPKVCRDVREKAQSAADEAIEKLLRIMRNDNHKQQMAAALAVLKAAGVSLSEEKTGDEQEQEPVAGKALGEMSEAELMAAASKGEA